MRKAFYGTLLPPRAIRPYIPAVRGFGVYRSRTGGTQWEALTNGLPQRDCYVKVLLDAMALDRTIRAEYISDDRQLPVGGNARIRS